MSRSAKALTAVAIAAGLVLGCGQPAGAAPPAPTDPALAKCPASVPFPKGVSVIKAVRVYTAADGESDFQTVTFTGEGKAYFKPGEIFTHTDLGASAKVQFVSGPPNVILKPHKAPREMFLTIQGSSEIVLPSGKTYPVRPGTLVIFDDATSKSGHGGRTGPCGYVAINILPAPDAK